MDIPYDKEGTVRAAATVGAAAATGGLSLFGQLMIDKAMADTDPCRTALDRTPRSATEGSDREAERRQHLTELAWTLTKALLGLPQHQNGYGV